MPKIGQLAFVDNNRLDIDSLGKLLVATGNRDSSDGDASTQGIAGLAANNNGDKHFLKASMRFWNGTNIDRARNNEEIVALASAARTADTNSSDIVNYNGKGVIMFINMTVAPGADNVTFNLQVKDPVGGGYHTIMSSAALTDIALTVLAAYPGSADVKTKYSTGFNDIVIPRVLRVNADHDSSTPTTYSVALVFV